MEYKKDVLATYDNAFCMDSNCICYFEDNCILALQNEKVEIFPDSTIYLTSRRSEWCKQFKAGSNLMYVEEVEAHE